MDDSARRRDNYPLITQFLCRVVVEHSLLMPTTEPIVQSVIAAVAVAAAAAAGTAAPPRAMSGSAASFAAA